MIEILPLFELVYFWPMLLEGIKLEHWPEMDQQRFVSVNIPAFDKISAFPPEFHLFQSSNYNSSVNSYCEKLFTLRGNTFLYD